MRRAHKHSPVLHFVFMERTARSKTREVVLSKKREVVFKAGLGIVRTNEDSQEIQQSVSLNSFFVETNQLVSSYVKMILTRQLCVQCSSMAAGSKRRAIPFVFIVFGVRIFGKHKGEPGRCLEQPNYLPQLWGGYD